MINKIIAMLIFMVNFYCIAYAQDNKSDSLAMYHPESSIWYPHSTPFYLFKGAVYSQSQVVWATSFHTATPVPLGCVGPEKYTRMLKSVNPNTRVAEVMKEALSDKVNVILVIGDGMGPGHFSLPVYMRLAKGDTLPTMFEKIMHEGDCGYLLTNPAGGLVTGSAAAGTALATGTKTRMDMVGVDTLGNPVKSALDVAVSLGMKTALVTDAAITDATPAAFYAHVIQRNLQPEIARQLAEENFIDVLLGGGASNFIPQNTTFGHCKDFEDCGFANDSSSRKDDINPIDTFKSHGYRLIHNEMQLQSVNNAEKVLGLFSPGGLPAPIDRNESNKEIPTVAQMSKKALELIGDNPKGFFIMTECARIDWEAHANDIGAVYKAVEEMNEVLKNAYRVYAKNPQKTLLIFCADHETGGLGIAYRKVDDNEKETFRCANGQMWETKTKALSFYEFKKLAAQDASLASIFKKSGSAEELQQNIEKHTAYTVSLYQAQKIFEAAYQSPDMPKYKK